MGYPFNTSKVKLVGSCDGLFCLWYNFNSGILLCLWNPATKEYKEIPKPPDDDLHGSCMVAFGYDSKSDDFKLLTDSLDSVQVYSLRLNSWKRIGNVGFRAINLVPGVLVNGDLHWLAKGEDYSDILVSADIIKERFKKMQLPKESLANEHRFMTVGVLEGRLRVLVRVERVCLVVWVMEDYGVPDSWSKRHVIKNELILRDCLPRLLWSFKSGEILFKLAHRGYLVLYDPKDDSATKRNIPGLTHCFNGQLYFESLVPLNSKERVRREEALMESLETWTIRS